MLAHKSYLLNNTETIESKTIIKNIANTTLLVVLMPTLSALPCTFIPSKQPTLAMIKAYTGAFNKPMVRERNGICCSNLTRKSYQEICIMDLVMIIPPNTPNTSAHIVNNGTTMNKPSSLGSSSKSATFTPIVVNASTSRLIFIIPICDVNADPVLPPTMMAVINGPNSRNIESPRKSTMKISAPYSF